MCPPTANLVATKPTASPTSIPSIVPNDEISRAAYLHAATNLHPSILNHSLRVWLYAKAISARESAIWTTSPSQTPLLFTSCILHDIGTSTIHDGPLRFEIEGADFAKSLLLSHNIPATSAHDVWTAIALHSTPQIPERISPLSRIVRIAVVVDFKSPTYLSVMTNDAEIQEFEGILPRDGIEKILGDVVAEQAVRQPGKAPAACWPGGLYRFSVSNPKWDGVNGEF